MLKKISFFGFKSFADRVEVDFSKGITAVIGPNGCGKSNIFDGVRWVLGEQSAKSLRGGKMDDVIFNGSETRKARDYAEVTLTLDNQNGNFRHEEKEISVTRRATRGKGSEYFVNGEPARLKDVHTLFLDTGVGSNSYSIIGQGQIGKILSTKLEERRAIFEEASGIVKLKQQKEQTEKNLREVDSNLVRIEDILKEIEKQLNPLRNQAEKAREYNELSQELQTIETQYLLHEFDKLEGKIQEAAVLVAEFEAKSAQLGSDLETKEHTYEETKEIYQTKNDDIFEFQKQVSSTKEEAEKLKGAINLNQERIEHTKRSISETAAQLKEIEETYSLSTEDFKAKQQRLSEIETLIAQFVLETKQLEEELTTLEEKKTSFLHEVNSAREQSISAYNQVNQEKYELEQLEKKENELQESLVSVSEKLELNIKEKQEIQKEYDETEESYKNASNYLQTLQEQFVQRKKEWDSLQKNHDQQKELLQETESLHIKKSSQLESVENFIENNENFFEGVKAVLQAKKDGKFDGVHGAIAELVKVKKEYETAAESLLQSSMQYLVTEDDKVAREAVNFLKQGRLGRATFLPLNLANVMSFDAREKAVIDSTKGITYAIDAVTADSKFSPILSSLLGRSIVADNLEIALDFVKSSKIRAKIATLYGEIVQSGSISGGQSKKQKTSYFGKRREMEELQEEVAELQQKIARLTVDKMERESKLKALLTEAQQLGSSVDSEKENVIEKQRLTEDMERKLNNHVEKMQEYQVQQEEMTLTLENVKKSIMNLRFSIEEKEKQYEELTSSLESLTKKQEENETQTEETKERKTNLTVESHRIEDEAKAIREFLDDFSEDSGSVEDKITKLNARKDEHEAKIVELEEEKGTLSTQYESISKQLQEENVSLEEMRTAIQSLVTEIETFEKEIKTLRSEKEQTDKEWNTKNLYLSKKETEKANIVARLQESYEIDEEAIAELERLDIDLSSSKKEIDRIKRKINSLGSINHSAIEDCEKLEERYKTEKTQFDDVKSAKADLMGLLKNVEEEMTTRFTETFNTIAEGFAKIFTDLFEGGKARLTLVDPNNPLGSAIDIIAQPPGKKPASIDQLSGGEKAFTAVALIFSIISAKPSPFVIFDEVDAPLDDANVARFAYYTKEYSKKCQFIIVTHRKSSMTAADVLYGVTQKERGCTIMFPYVLEDMDETMTS